MTATGRRLAVGARFAVSAALLVALSFALGPAEIAGRLADLSGPWLAAGLAISVAQVFALAWRWRYTAVRLGIDLPFSIAVREYYLSLFLNQVLPGGVPGDVARAWRHARAQSAPGAAVRAVVLERGSAQVVMTATALGSILALGAPFAFLLLSAVCVSGVWLAARVVARRARVPGSLASRVQSDVRRALLAGDALPVQAASAAAVVASYIVVYLVAARAIGADAGPGTLLPLVAPVLMAMLLPVAVAGWGVREGAAAWMWALAGLPPQEGVAVSVAYGILVLASSLPGLAILIWLPLAGRDRRARPDRGGSDGNGAAGPGPGTRSGRG